jgi:hypothetical protein
MRFKILLALLPALLTLPVGSARAEDYPSTYAPLPSEPTLITHATILTGTGERLDDASLLLSGGKVVFVGKGEVPAGVNTVDAKGRWVTPGLIDVHSHLGVYASPRLNNAAMLEAAGVEIAINGGETHQAGQPGFMEWRPAGSHQRSRGRRHRWQTDTDGVTPDKVARPLPAAESGNAEGLYQALKLYHCQIKSPASTGLF